MLLINVNLNSKINQKAAIKSFKTAEKQNLQIGSDTVNFKGGEKMKVINLAKPRRKSIQFLSIPSLETSRDELTAFLSRHKDIFAGLEFTQTGDKFISREIEPDKATQITDAYTDKVNAALTKAAQNAVPAPRGIKVFLENLLTLRTKVFPFDVQDADGRIQLTTYPQIGNFFYDPQNEHSFLNEINPKLYEYIENNGLGIEEIKLSDGSRYNVLRSIENNEVNATPQGSNNSTTFISKILRGITYIKKN